MPDVGEVSSQGAPRRAKNVGQRLAELNANDTFLGLGYAEQTAVRQLILQKFPEYQVLDDADKKTLLKAVSEAPPAYRDKSFQDYQKQFESLGASVPYMMSFPLTKTIVGKIAGKTTGAILSVAGQGKDPYTKFLQGDPDAAKLNDYLSAKYGTQIAMPEGIRDAIVKTPLQYVPIINVLGSPNLAAAIGDFVGVMGDITAVSGKLPVRRATSIAKAGLLNRAGVAAERAVGGALVSVGAKGMAPAIATVGAKVAADFVSGAAIGTARAALVDPDSVSDAQGLVGTALGWGVAGATLGAFEGGRQITAALTRARAMAETVSGRYPRLLAKNATERAQEMYATRQLKSSDPDFIASPEGVKDAVLTRESIEASKSKLGPQALQIDPVARLQAQLKVGPLGNRGLDLNMMPNGDGTFRMREVPDAGGQIVTVQNPQRGAAPQPLSNITLVEASKEGARRYAQAMASADVRVAQEVKNVAAKKDLVDRLSPLRGQEVTFVKGNKTETYHTLGALPLDVPPRSVETSPVHTEAARALAEAKRSLASALFDRKGLEEFANRPGSTEASDIAVIAKNLKGLENTLSAGAEDIVPMSQRAAISVGEQQMLEGTQGLKTVSFMQAIDPAQLPDIGKRKVFLDTDNPLKVKPGAASDANALGVYSAPMKEEMFARLQVAANIVKQQTGQAVDPLDLAYAYALQAGADAIEHADGSVTLLYPREQAKHVSDFMDPKTGRYYLPRFVRKGALNEEGIDVRATNKLAGEVRISQTVKQIFPGIAEPKVMEGFLQQKTLGELQAMDVELLTKTALAEMNLPTERVRVARIEREPGDMSVVIKHGVKTTTVAVPKQVNGALEQQAFLKNYTNALNEAGKEYHGANAAERRLAERVAGEPAMSDQRKRVLLDMMKEKIKASITLPHEGPNPMQGAVASNVFRAPTPGSDPKMMLSWFLDATKKVPGTGLTPVSGQGLADGVFQLSMADKDAFVGSLQACVDEFLVQNTTQGALRHDLALKGYDLKTGAGQVWVEGRNGKVLGGRRFDDHVALMKELGLRPDKIDGRFGPDTIEVTDNGVAFSYQAGSVSASLQKAYQFAAKFADMSEHDVQKVVLRQKEGTVSKSATSGMYVVDMKELGVHKTFKSAAKAYKYLRGEVYDIHNLIIDAEHKGFVLYREDGNYVVSGPEGRHVVGTREEVRKVLASVPDAEWAPNLLGSYDKPVLDSSEAPGPGLFPDSPLLNPLARWTRYGKEVMANYLQPAASRMKSLADRLKMPEVNKAFSDVRTNTKVYEHQLGLVQNATADILKAGKNTPMNANESARFMEYMEANREDVKRRILKDLFGEDLSSPAAKRFVQQTEKMRDVLGRTPTTGMHAAMGLESGKFEVSWMPRLQKKLAGDPAWINKYASMEDGAQAMMRELHAGNTPKNLDFTSRYMRVSDYVDLARDTNSVRALSNYYRQGLFWYHVGPSLEKFFNLTHADGVSQVLRERADHYIRVAVAGVKNDLTNINRAVARELSLMSPEAGDAANWMLNMGTSGIFLWKWWSAVRQVFDAYASAAPILGGNKFLDEGMKIALTAYKKELQKGIDVRTLNERLPTSEPTTRSSRFFSWYFKTAHALVQSGDVLPRMAVYEAATKQFERGMQMMKENPALTLEQAMYSWVYLQNPEQVKDAWMQGDFKAAAHFFADNLQERTNGSFRPQDQGMLRNSFGIIGRFWGQLMTMPMFLNDLRKDMITKGTVSQRALTTSIMAKNMAMIAASLNIVGIDGSSYLPWNDLTVSGGPTFNQMITVIQASNAPTAAERDRELKKLLLSIGTRDIPFGTFVQRVIRANEYMKQGAAWKAMLAITATPIAKGSLADMFSGKGYVKKRGG